MARQRGVTGKAGAGLATVVAAPNSSWDARQAFAVPAYVYCCTDGPGEWANRLKRATIRSRQRLDLVWFPRLARRLLER